MNLEFNNARSFYFQLTAQVTFEARQKRCFYHGTNNRSWEETETLLRKLNTGRLLACKIRRATPTRAKENMVDGQKQTIENSVPLK